MNINEQFIQIVKANYLISAAALLKNLGADINYHDNELGYTALMHAAMNGDIKTFRWLHKNGANIHAVDDAGRTAFMFAASKSKEIVDYCLKQKVPIDCKSSYNRTALTFAVQAGNVEIVKTLLFAGADPNTLDLVDNNALHHVSLISNRKSMIKIGYLLLKAGVRLETKNKYGDVPLLTACKNRESCFVSQLIEFGVNPFVTDTEGMTAFLHACYTNDTCSFIELLLTVPERILFAQTNNDGCDGLTLAEQGLNTEILKLYRSSKRDSLIEQHRKKKITKLANGKNVCKQLFNRQIGASHSLKSDYYLRPSQSKQTRQDES
jgi:ankyrin repeat protein